jgi:hypothetical protein
MRFGADSFRKSILLLALPLILGAFSGKQSPQPGDSSSAQSSGETVWVSRPDGSKSCSGKSGASLDDGTAELKGLKIQVLDSRKSSDGKMHSMMCGASTGSSNAYLIPKAQLLQAIAAGYSEQVSH